MSNQYLSFDVTKQSAPQQLITGRQGDSQLKFVSVLLWDGDKNIPYDLTGKQVAFEALKPDGTHIVDYDGITTLDAPHGLFRYSFNEQVFAIAGTMKQAFFKITHTDKDDQVITDSTLEINIHILENRVEFGINSTDYLSEYDDLIAQVKKKFEDYADTVQDSIDKAQQVHDEVTKLLAQLDDIELAMKRRVAVKDSNTVKLSQTGDWDSEATTTLSAEVKVSDQIHEKSNLLTTDEAGLYVPDLSIPGGIADITKKPVYYGALDSIQQTVSQSILMASNFEIYNVQSGVLNPPDSERHATINHLTPSGVIIDTMEILHSGHGAGWNIIQDIGDKVKILFIAQKAGVNKIVSIDYQAGARIDIFDDTAITTYPNPNNEDLFLAVDIKNNQIVGIDNNDTGTDKIYVYDYNEFLESGLGATKQKTIDVSVTTLQGVLLDDNHVYIYNSTIDADDAYILDLSITDGSSEKISLGRIGQDPQLKYTQSLEGEGMFSWTNPDDNQKSYFIAVATGFAGGTKRVVKLYAWHSPDNQVIFDNLFNEKSQALKSYDSDGSAFTLDTQPTLISDIATPGTYYFNGDNFNKFTDIPTGYGLGTSGFFLNVYPNNKAYIFKQEIFRLHGDYPMKFERYVDRRNGVINSWKFNPSNLEFTLKPKAALKKLSDLTARGSYYLNVQEWNALTDVPNSADLGYGTSGFFVDISKQSNGAAFIQRAVRNTTTDNTVELIRTVFADGTASNWIISQSDNSAVHNTGNETIAGNKTLTGLTTMITGKYGFRVTSSGFEKTTDGGKTWAQAEL